MKWEYLHVELEASHNLLQKTIDEKGQGGWELVGVAQNPYYIPERMSNISYLHLFFKRPVE